MYSFLKQPAEDVTNKRREDSDYTNIRRTRIQPYFSPSRSTRPPRTRNTLSRLAAIRRPSILLLPTYLPTHPSTLSLPPPWTPMETVASWHGEVNYKRYQSLGVVGRSVGLGSTDSQLPLRADPRARATVPSLSFPLLSLSLPLP